MQPHFAELIGVAAAAASLYAAHAKTMVDIESQAAFVLLGLAARTLSPISRKDPGGDAVIDLVPLAANASRNIEAAIAEFQSPHRGDDQG